MPLLLSQFTMFEAKHYVIHAKASSVILLVLGSVLLACAVSMPVMLMSSGYFI